MLSSKLNLKNGEYMYLCRIYSKMNNEYVYKCGDAGNGKNRTIDDRLTELNRKFGCCTDKEPNNLLLLLLAKIDGQFDEAEFHEKFKKYRKNVKHCNGTNSKECYPIDQKMFKKIKQYFIENHEVVHELDYSIDYYDEEKYQGYTLSKTYYDDEDEAMDGEDTDDVRSNDGFDDGSDLDDFIENDRDSDDDSEYVHQEENDGNEETHENVQGIDDMVHKKRRLY